MELAATLRAKHFVETISPVDTHQAHHRKEDAHTQTGTALHVERIELAGFLPSVTGLKESKTVDGGVTKQEWIAKLKAETVVVSWHWE